jgi:hypothetical protein
VAKLVRRSAHNGEIHGFKSHLSNQETPTSLKVAGVSFCLFSTYKVGMSTTAIYQTSKATGSRNVSLEIPHGMIAPDYVVLGYDGEDVRLIARLARREG